MTTSDDLLVIAIDGPAGAGKSTVARALAARLGLHYLDTGAMYRGVTVAALRRGIDVHDLDAVAALAPHVALDVGDRVVLVDGVDATAAIREPEINVAVSAVAANQRVRAELVRRQREWAAVRGGGVLEGRDIGSVVFPDAALKLYLTAPVAVRAARRHREMPSQGALDDVAAAIEARDARDRGREHAPLVEADGATVLDTGHRSVDEIVEEIAAMLDRRLAQRGRR